MLGALIADGQLRRTDQSGAGQGVWSETATAFHRKTGGDSVPVLVMDPRHRPAPDEAAASSNHVLLEQSTSFSGRQLALRVTTADAANPDAITVHVSYGSGRAEFVVRADKESREVRGSTTASTPLADGTSGSSLNADPERAEMTASASREGEGDRERPAVAGESVHPQAQDVAGVSSRRRGNIADASPTRGTELCIGKDDPPAILDDDALEKRLRRMPNLRRLIVEWRPDGKKLDVDIVSKHCPNLVELDLTRFRLDPWSLEQLCKACPKLEVVKLPRKCDDSSVEVLLQNLPRLRSLDLSCSQVTGQFFRIDHESIEKLSLFGCQHLKQEVIDKALRQVGFAFFVPPTSRWRMLRELDLGSSSWSIPAHITQILKYFPRIERLHLVRMSGSITPGLSLCESLLELDVSHVSSLHASDIVNLLTRCTQLERLSLASSSIQEPNQLRQLDQHPTALCLRELDISGVTGYGFPHNVTHITSDDLVAILKRSPKLERLLAAELVEADLNGFITQLARCTELRELDISCAGTLGEIQPTHFGMSRAGTLTVQVNARCSSGLSILEKIERNRQIQSSVLTSLLSSCQKLERLVLAGRCIPESASVRHLAQCPRLRELNLSRVTIVKAGEVITQGNLRAKSVDAADLAQGLSGCPLLESLSVEELTAPLEQIVPPTNPPKLVYLDASRSSGLTNNSLRRLPGLFPKLHTLNIQGCKRMSEDGLMAYLPRLKRLRSLDVRNVSGMTKAVEETLKTCKLTELRLRDD